VSVDQPVIGRKRVCVAGRSVEPTISTEQLAAALKGEEVERFRPLLPVGEESVVRAYAAAAADLTVDDLSNHYTSGLEYFHDEFAPQLKARLTWLSGGVWSSSVLQDYVAYAAGSDVDLMSHVIEAIAAREKVALYPGDWFGFRVGSTHQQNIEWMDDAQGRLACLCVPSVRNGHLTAEMVSFLASSSACLLNLNLYPTLSAGERADAADALRPVLNKSLLSISFSRGFGLTASQLGVLLVHYDHPYRKRFEEQWNWLTYFYNALAARAFLRLDLAHLDNIHIARREQVAAWLTSRGLPAIRTGSYYVKSFSIAEELLTHLRPLQRDGLVRLCFKPTALGV
jgi:hypothetical protein